MKIFSGVLIAFYLLVTALWVANSSYLFSPWGIIIWIISIILGFASYKQVKESKIMGKLILFASSFMVFLVIVTLLISWAVSSMP